MFVHRSASGVIARAPAKINLFFEVLGRRDDGFHEVETLMIPVSLYDSLVFAPDTTGNISLSCRWADLRQTGTGASLGTLPSSAENLVTKAVQLLRERAGIQLGARLTLVKRIPSAAGLGGGSSDAAAALLAANMGWNLKWSRERLAKLAAELGSDVPFFLDACPAVCRGRGEQIEPVGPLPTLHVVIVRPPAGLSTAAVYAASTPSARPQQVEPLVEALRQGNLGRSRALVRNRLEEPAASLSPWVGRLRDEFKRVDCVAAQMSGSGTSYFGICRSARHARRVAARLRSRSVGRVYQVHS